MSNNEHIEEFIATFMEEASETLEQWEKTCLDMEKNPSAETFKILFRYAHNLKGSSRSVNLDSFASFIHKVEDVISLLRDGKCEYSSEFVSLFLKCHSFMESWCQELQSDLSFIPIEIVEIEHIISKVIKKIEINSASDGIHFEFFNYKSSNKETEKNQNEADFGFFNDSEQDNETDSKQPEKSKLDKNTPNKSQDTIRIPSSKIDLIMHYISELCTHHSIISHCSITGKFNTKSFKNSIHICEKIIKELQSNVFSLRMIPLNSFFQRLERAAKSLAMQQNKEVDIITEGSHVELDKNIIEKFLDPLVHVIRNAVDHGIETNEERIAKNKPLKSKIQISAQQSISHVCITISDDGKGINPKIILKKALQKNLVPEESNLTEQEIYQLIFLPGFSTVETVTEVSGRGVGLDVVKQVLNEINGFVNIQSQVDKGSIFEFHLPSNLSIIDVLTIKVANLNYVIPISEIDEVLDLSKLKFNKVTNSERISFIRKIPVIVKDLSTYLNHDKNSGTPIDKKIGIMIEANHSFYAFEIDELIGIECVVFRKKSEKFIDIKYYTGSAVLPNGEPAFILSLKELVLQLIVPRENHIKMNFKEELA